jgi:superfamily II DNA/RNA helicase
MLNEYEFIQLSQNKPTKSVYQDIVMYQSTDEKIEKLSNILSESTVTKTLIFVETKRYADRVGKALFIKGHKNGVIHGDKRQNQRKKTLDSFKRSHINVLVATNVAARGIDIDDITHVINLDTPTSDDDYIHRIGRVGRNGNTGTAFTFVVGK